MLLDTLQHFGTPAYGLVVEEAQRERAAALVDLFGLQCVLTDEEILAGPVSEIALVNGVGSVGDVTVRRRLYQTYCAAGFRFAEVVHPAAVVSRHARLTAGAQVLAGAIIQAGVRVGANSIVNTGAVIDHDCVIGDHTHVAPSAVLSGNVYVGSGCHIGTGARIIQGVEIGDGCVVGAGAVVIRDVAPNKTVVGVPARVLTK